MVLVSLGFVARDYQFNLSIADQPNYHSSIPISKRV